MALIGLHLSSAGSLTLLPQRARSFQIKTFQFFLGSPRLWKPKSPTEEEKKLFKEELKEFVSVLHAPYLLNPASAEETLRKKTEERLLFELSFCEEVGVDFYNLHPGTAKGLTEREALSLVLKTLSSVLERASLKKTVLLFENTAGQRGDLGKSLEELAFLIRELEGFRVGLCVDTCHAFAYGYDLSSEEGFKAFKGRLEELGLLDKVMVVHANDAKLPLRSRRDRHQHIGMGYMGLKAFELLLSDEHFSRLPFILETPKEGNMDEVNLKTLRDLAG